MPHARLLQMLADGRCHSGTDLGARLGVSRAAIWKHLQQLQDWGMKCVSLPGQGYQLTQPLDLLDEEALQQQIQEAGVPLLHWYYAMEIDSTNSYLQSLPRQTGKGWNICLAERQSAGRGRRGRQWQSPFAANIYLSMRREFAAGLESLSGLSLAVGIAVADALDELGVPGVQLKWPNDIRMAGAKLGGVLIELSGEAQGPCHVVIGVGLNVHMPIEAGAAIEQAWTALDQHPPGSLTRTQLSAALIRHLHSMSETFEREGFAPLAARFMERDEFLQAEVNILGLNEKLHGTVAGVDEHGALLLQTATGLRKLHGGEVSLRRA